MTSMGMSMDTVMVITAEVQESIERKVFLGGSSPLERLSL
jgi:hypothetical protein